MKTSKADRDIGLWFYKKGQEPKHRSYPRDFTGPRSFEMLDIPPKSYARTRLHGAQGNALIENFQPHFHLAAARRMQVEAIRPDGQRQVISYVSNFNFNWMTNYIYDADEAAPCFPKGTVIHVSAWFDNTRGNKNNPDPSNGRLRRAHGGRNGARLDERSPI